MSESDKRPGRPRQPDAKSGSLRVAEHRASLEAEGWRRAEVLVPTRLRPRLEEIARTEGAGLADTMSALLQFGVEQYELRTRGERAAPAAFDLESTALQAHCASAASEALPLPMAPHESAHASVVPVLSMSAASFAPPRALRSAARSLSAAASARPSSPVTGALGACVGSSLPTPGQSSPLSTYLRKKKD